MKLTLKSFPGSSLSTTSLAAVNRGHKHTDLIIMDFAKAFDKVTHRRLYYTHSNTMGLEGPSIDGPTRGSLGALNK